MTNLSSAMGKQFADNALALTEEIRRLGPSPLRPSHTPDPGSGPQAAPEPGSDQALGHRE